MYFFISGCILGFLFAYVISFYFYEKIFLEENIYDDNTYIFLNKIINDGGFELCKKKYIVIAKEKCEFYEISYGGKYENKKRNN